MKTRKSTSFWAAFWALLAIYFGTLFLAPETLAGIGQTVILGIVAAGGFYQGTNVADNALKGKYFRPELDGKE